MITPRVRHVSQFITILMFGFSSLVNAALVARDLDGDLTNGHEGVYDTVLNITWMANANLAAIETFGVAGIVLNESPGRMQRHVADSWIAAMNISNGGSGYLGINAWRLPIATPLDGTSFYDLQTTYDGGSDFGYQISAPIDPLYNALGQSPGATNSELAYHYYNNFGAIGACTATVSSAQDCSAALSASIFLAPDFEGNKSLFTGLSDLLSHYWTGSATLDSDILFNIQSGNQHGDVFDAGRYSYVWAVTDGDVGTAIVPLPSAIWLFMSGIFGVGIIARRLMAAKL